ncbi:Retrovirus-related Pol polyprotein from transposon 17.6, partial [Araneus ventricosus]
MGFRTYADTLIEGIVIIYVDDIIIPSIDELDGLKRLSRLLQTASEYGLELNWKKCNFLKSKIEFLGYIIENGKISPSLDKTVAVQNFPEPKSVKQVQSFLGLTGYFRKFIQNYALVAKPLSDLLRDNTEFYFGPQQKSALQSLKQKLSENPVLHIFKQGAKLELHTDASKFLLCAILFQQSDDNKFHPIHYMSRKTSPQEEKFSSYELEVLAIIEALKKFRNYLVGSKFRIITDCSAFQKTMSKTQLTPKIARWALFLEDFNYEIVPRYQHIFTVVDAFTKFTWFYPVKSPSAQEGIDKLKLQQTIFGNPSRIITDRGSAFTANEFETYCSEEGIQHLKITTGIPRGNGQIERMHRILEPVLSKLSHGDPTKWFKHVPTVQRVINSSTSRSMKYTPFELMMGTKMKN